MGKLLRFKSILKIATALVVSILFVSEGMGQFSITSTRAFELSFKKDETREVPGGLQVSIREPHFMNRDDQYAQPANEYLSSDEKREGLFYVETFGQLSLGRYYHRLESAELISLPLENKTDRSFDRLSLAFDFVYLEELSDRSNSFTFSYRRNGGEWIHPSEAQFSTNFFNRSGRGWGSFSMQISLDQVYLRPEDQIELRWSASVKDDSTAFVPIALQKVDIMPSVAREKQVRAGSLIISEVLPRTDTDEGPAEYIELYNSTDRPLDLKGLILDSGRNKIVIQHNLTVAPYQTVVIGRRGGPQALTSSIDYFYDGPLLDNEAGRIELSYEAHEVAKLLYESSEPGVAFQIDHAEHAYDGYTGLRHLLSINKPISETLYGDPGYLDPERKLFSKEVRRKGWHLLRSPGRLSPELNRDVDGRLQRVMTGTGAGLEEEAALFMYYHESPKAQILYSAGNAEGSEPDQIEESQTSPLRIGAQLNPLSLKHTEPLTINQIVNQNGSRAYPALLGWNSDKQNFEIIWNESRPIDPWSGVLAPFIAGEEYTIQSIRTEKNEGREGRPLDRVLELTLSANPRSNGAEELKDTAVIGFWNTPGIISNEMMDLPKLWSPIDRTDQAAVRSPIIYLKSPDAAYPANSYINYGRIPEESVQVAVGTRLDQLNERYTIRWNYLESIPEHWEIEFVDAELDEIIDMRNESSYTFFDRSEKVTQGMRNPDLNFLEVEPTSYNRFYVRISPSGQLDDFHSENETPGAAELKQNYPNPFNPSTTVLFYLPESENVEVAVYNVVGQKVAVLVDDQLSAGEHTVSWNAMDMPSGVYIVQLEAGNTVDTKKITLIK
ncbi:MAG: T9SS type A sorting domain-containing protein [Bacteroidetes bacterium]|jgi:hypothetical protein|nr:T9SS type A sorting domain-containing protein [Bacteroidota bacterium]